MRSLGKFLRLLGLLSAAAICARPGRTTIANDEVGADSPLISFLHDVLPVMSKAGCNQGSCHGAASGKGGFKLSLRGYAPELDYLAIRREEMGRRVDLAEPTSSLILRKPTLDIAHRGGKALAVDSEGYRILADWVRQGAPPPDAHDPKLVELSIEPATATLEPGEAVDLRVIARFSNGAVRDVTRWARYDSNEAMVAVPDTAGRARAVGPGTAAISAAYQDQVSAIELTVPFPKVEQSDARDYAALPRANYIDDLVIAQWQRLRLWPSAATDDATFFRRVHLDVTGVLPDPAAVRAFLADTNPAKREAAIDRLLDRPEFADLWAQRWGDVFRLSREWLGEKSMWTFHNYLRDRIARNVPWDQVVRELVAGTGDSGQEGPPNFYRLQKVYNEGELWPLTAAETTAQTFLGVRLQCARCHNHPFDRWTQSDYYGMVSFFAQVGSKPSADNSVVIFDTGQGEISHPRLGRAMPPKTPAGPALSDVSDVWLGAAWVWDDPGAASQPLSVDQRDAPRFLRRVFDLSAVPATARIAITADDSYILFVNGTQVGADGAWSPAESFEITSLLTPGRNVLAIQATNQLGPGGTIAWLGLIAADGSSTVIGTDADWRITTAAGQNWTTLAYDDSSWQPASVLGPASMGPWGLSAAAVGLPQLPKSGRSRRQFLADWITQADNPFFARATANRVWRHYLGRGLIEPVDDLRASNPATNGPLLDALAADLAAHQFDLKHLMRTILRSNTYQLSSRPTTDNRADTRFCSHYLPKRQSAEGILDAIGQLTGRPEQFAGLPPSVRAQQLPDSKVVSAFLDTFGRPLRRVASCECERVQDPNLRQALEMMHSPLLHERVTADDALVDGLVKAGADDAALVEEIYVRALGRPPSANESAAFLSARSAEAGQTTGNLEAAVLRRQFFEDLLWAVINSREFLFNH